MKARQLTSLSPEDLLVKEGIHRFIPYPRQVICYSPLSDIQTSRQTGFLNESYTAACYTDARYRDDRLVNIIHNVPPDANGSVATSPALFRLRQISPTIERTKQENNNHLLRKLGIKMSLRRQRKHNSLNPPPPQQQQPEEVVAAGTNADSPSPPPLSLNPSWGLCYSPPSLGYLVSF